MSRMRLSQRERRFLASAAGTVIPVLATDVTGIDVLANIESMLEHSSADHRWRVVQIVRWSYRASWLYGGVHMPMVARRSRLIPVRRLAHALASICLLAFWDD